jgi:hypothetical protein
LSGSHYRFTAARKGQKLCERLVVTAGDTRSRLKNCQPLAPAKTLSGYWNLDCRTGDLFVFGSVAGKRAKLVWTGRGGKHIPLTQTVGGHRAFLAALSSKDLPGVLRARRGDRTVDKLALDSRHALCHDVGAVGHAFFIF